MTAQELVEAALAECAEFSVSFPGSHDVLYRRAGVRQQQLFARAGMRNKDYVGVCATAVVTNGQVNLRELVAGTVAVPEGQTPPSAAQRFTRIEVADKGTSAYEDGDEVHVIDSGDGDTDDSAFPPRVTIRDRILKQVGTDLAGVAKLEMMYARRPAPITAKANVVELVPPFEELLVFDLCRDLVNRAQSLDKEIRDRAMAYFKAREDELLADFDAHVDSFVPTVRR